LGQLGLRRAATRKSTHPRSAAAPAPYRPPSHTHTHPPAPTHPPTPHTDTLPLPCCVQSLDEYWLRDGDYVAGGAISIADLLLACEVQQLELLDGATEASVGGREWGGAGAPRPRPQAALPRHTDPAYPGSAPPSQRVPPLCVDPIH
jgi:hypothetical protein